MRLILFSIVSLFLFVSATQAGPPVTKLAVDCNWGKLTMESIVGKGFDQGRHASDPSGDGHGPGTLDEPRAGLANVVNQGDLQALCALIEELMEP